MLPVIPNVARPHQSRPFRLGSQARNDRGLLEELLREQDTDLKEADRVYEQHISETQRGDEFISTQSFDMDSPKKKQKPFSSIVQASADTESPLRKLSCFPDATTPTQPHNSSFLSRGFLPTSQQRMSSPISSPRRSSINDVPETEDSTDPLLMQLAVIEAATNRLRDMKSRYQGKKVRDASTQYMQADYKPLVSSASQNLLGFTCIPVRVTRSKSDVNHHENVRQLLTGDLTDTDNKQMKISAALYETILELQQSQHDLSSLCSKFSEAVTNCIKGECVIFTCLGNEIVKMGNRMETFDLDRGIVGHVNKTKVGIALRYPSSHGCFDPEVDECDEKGSDDGVYFVPLRWASRVAGVVRFSTNCESPAVLSCVSTLILHAASLIMLHHPDLAKMEINANLLTAVGDLSTTMFEDHQLADRIMESSKMLLKAERCALFRVDEEEQQLVSELEGEQVRISINSGIAGFVAVSGEGQNIPNAYLDPRFNRNVDKLTGFRTNQILCMPLKCDGKVLAVAQLVNKVDNEPFSKYDEKVFETYSSFAAVALRNFEIFNKAAESNEYNKLLLELANELGKVTLDDSAVKEKVIQCATRLVKADRGALFHADWDRSVLVGSVGERVIEMPINAGIAGAVALSGKEINVVNAYEDSRFNKKVDQITGYITETILSCPIKYAGKVIAVAQLINKRPTPSGKHQIFTHSDVVILESFGTLAGVAMRTAHQYRKETIEKENYCRMLGAVGNIVEFDMRGEVDLMCQKIANDACLLAKAAQVNIYVEDNGKIPDEPTVSSMKDGRLYHPAVIKEAMEKGRPITKHKPVGVSRDELGQPQTGQFARDVLALPVSCEQGLHKSDKSGLLAVAEFINKEEGTFNSEDVQRVEYYLRLCAFTIRNSRLLSFEKQNRKGAMELLTHTKRHKGRSRGSKSGEGKEAVSSLCRKELKVAEAAIKRTQITSFSFDLSCVAGDVQQLAHIRFMFREWGLLEELNIEEQAFFNFFLCVKKKYRSVPYHNFLHALDVTQAVFSMMCMLETHMESFTHLEKFVLLLCALCHDVDHMGVNHSFHYGTETPLGILSNATGSTSPLEVHHCNMMFGVMQRSGCDLLTPLTHEKQTDAYKLSIELILATDMARHAELLKEFTSIAYDRTLPYHRQLAMVMILKFADISNQARPFETGKKWAEKITEEFHCQGDAEKVRLGHVTMAHFDRDKAELPELQASFISNMCEPLITEIMTVFPELYVIKQQLRANRELWAEEQAASKGDPSPSTKPEILVSEQKSP